jgi:hypothetical protein
MTHFHSKRKTFGPVKESQVWFQLSTTIFQGVPPEYVKEVPSTSLLPASHCYAKLYREVDMVVQLDTCYQN